MNTSTNQSGTFATGNGPATPAPSTLWSLQPEEPDADYLLFAA